MTATKEQVKNAVNLCPKQFKVVALRDCLPYDAMFQCPSPEDAARYWTLNIAADINLNLDSQETFVVLMLNTRRRVIGHLVVSSGTLDTILVHPRDVFRGALIANAAAIILMHNHPSGDPTPSDGDIKVTRDLIRAGQLLKVEVLDHVIMGRCSTGVHHVSLRELGYFSL